MERTDKFRPSVIDPTKFEFVCHHYIGGMSNETWESLADVLAEAEEQRKAHEAAHPGFTVAGHKWPGQCDCCGARYKFGATFHTAETNTYIAIGSICAGKLSLGSPGAMKTFREQVNTFKIHAKRVAKAREYLTSVGLIAMLDLFLSKDSSIEFAERTLREMAGKVVQYGNELSEKQRAFAARLLTEIIDRPRVAAERAAKDEARQPVPVSDKRMTVTGVVISAKHQEGGWTESGFYSPSCIKMTVESVDGWRVWGTAPADLVNDLHESTPNTPTYLSDDKRAELLKGKTVRFDARVTRSEKDNKFGFFKRPTKAEVVA